jgi:rare lipoprotein A (peptidoglycan hydrolase)
MQAPRLRGLALAIVLALLVVASSASATSLVLRPAKPAASMSLDELEHFQVRAVAHYRGAARVCARVRPVSSAARAHCSWFRHAVRWTSRELAETRSRIEARVAARQLAATSYATASWYGPGFYGHGMACGGVLTETTIGVAHRTLPCGTRLTICYSGRCIVTSVVDRGPFVPGRDFDLTGGLKVFLGFGSVGPVSWRLGP